MANGILWLLIGGGALFYLASQKKDDETVSPEQEDCLHKTAQVIITDVLPSDPALLATLAAKLAEKGFQAAAECAAALTQIQTQECISLLTGPVYEELQAQGPENLRWLADKLRKRGFEKEAACLEERAAQLEAKGAPMRV